MGRAHFSSNSQKKCGRVDLAYFILDLGFSVFIASGNAGKSFSHSVIMQGILWP